jgi:pyruvate,water dikinase
MGRRIWELAWQARQAPEVAQTISDNDPKKALSLLRAMSGVSGADDFLRQLDQFLAIHGHRTLKEFEINAIRWEEDPAPVIAMIKNYLQSDVNPSDAQVKVNNDRQKFVERIKAALSDMPLEKQLGLRWWMVQYLRKQAKYFIRLRENSRFYHIMGFYAVRKKILKVEAELIQDGKLKCKDDVYYLLWDELQDLSDGKFDWADVEERIRERRMEFIRLAKISPPKTFGIHMTATDVVESDGLSGQGASPGTCEGIARVVMDPGIDAELHPGEILVAPYTDPAWTPLFLTASAAVVEIGSYLSHAGTIAREYGMPCVVDADSCTQLIKTGDRIFVDGTNGIVKNLSQDSKSDPPLRGDP